ncbi:MAG: hypothetical protein LBM67_04080 [Lentimicrobiaceae bacterium]|jgi:cytoskeletal protein RodZ|nr:hypothetical protein [Lentimicrobiaceae bacterium]
MKKIVLSSLFLMAFVLGFSQISVAQSVTKSSDKKKEIKKADPQTKKEKSSTIKNAETNKKQAKKTKPGSNDTEVAPKKPSTFKSSKQNQPITPVAPQPKKEKEKTEKPKGTPKQ